MVFVCEIWGIDAQNQKNIEPLRARNSKNWKSLKKFNFSDYFERSVSFGSTVVVAFREQVYKEHI